MKPINYLSIVISLCAIANSITSMLIVRRARRRRREMQ